MLQVLTQHASEETQFKFLAAWSHIERWWNDNAQQQHKGGAGRRKGRAARGAGPAQLTQVEAAAQAMGTAPELWNTIMGAMVEVVPAVEVREKATPCQVCVLKFQGLQDRVEGESAKLMADKRARYPYLPTPQPSVDNG